MRRSADFWRGHWVEMTRRECSIAEYAREHELVEGTLRWWSSKLRGEVHPKVAQSDRFVALQVREAAPTTTGSVTLRVGGEVRIELPGLPAPQWLAALARSLNEAR
jgi:hypothetical protein